MGSLGKIIFDEKRSLDKKAICLYNLANEKEEDL